MRTNKWSPFLFLAPFFLIMLVFNFFPIVFSMAASFMKWDGVNEMRFIGFKNYIRLVTSDTMFFKSFLNTLFFSLVAIPLQLVTGLFLAVVLHGILNRFRPFFQLVNFLPYLTTPVAVGLIFQTLFDWKSGAVNYLLTRFGITQDPFNWLGTPWGIKALVIIIVWWKYYGYFMVIILAGLSTIPESIYEAARLDGAKWYHSFFKITLPYLKPIMNFILTMSLIGGLQMFDEPYVVFQQTTSRPLGGADNAALTMVMNYYDRTFNRFDFGYGASIAYVLFIIIFVASLAMTKLMRERD